MKEKIWYDGDRVKSVGKIIDFPIRGTHGIFRVQTEIGDKSKKLMIYNHDRSVYAECKLTDLPESVQSELVNRKRLYVAGKFADDRLLIEDIVDGW